MKGMIKVFPECSTILREWGINNRIGKRVNTGKCMGSFLVGRPRKRGSDSVNDCLKIEIVGQARRMVHDKNKWQGDLLGD